MRFIYTSLSKIGLKRHDNEDSVGVANVNDGILAIVCDGLGGNKAGDIASRFTVETIIDYFRNSDEDNYIEKIKNAIIEANNRLLNESSANPDYKGMATTVEVLFLNSNSAFWGHVGDSRIYNLMDGKLKQITKDHSLVQKLLDEGYITKEEAAQHPNKNIIMRALGENIPLDIDLSKMKLKSKDDFSFFMCSDGVTNVVDDDELEQLLKSRDLNYIANELSYLIEDRGAPDNYSFVIIAKVD